MSLLAGRFAISTLAVLLVLGAAFAAGNRYGPNARNWQACLTETARRNTAIERANQLEEVRRAREERERALQDKVFAEASKNLKQCLLTKDQSSALNLIKD